MAGEPESSGEDDGAPLAAQGTETERAAVEATLGLRRGEWNYALRYRPHSYLNYISNPDYTFEDGSRPHNEIGIRDPGFDPRVKRDARSEVNLHAMPGGHSLEQLHKALGVAIRPDRIGDELSLSVELTNRGAGHAVPTGMPGRRIVLELEVTTSDGLSFDDLRTYGKYFQNAEGKTISHVADYFGRGVRLESDTRIGVIDLADHKRFDESFAMRDVASCRLSASPDAAQNRPPGFWLQRIKRRDSGGDIRVRKPIQYLADPQQLNRA